MTLPRFYPIFDSSDWIERVLPLGVKLVQLRIKERSKSQIRDEVRRSRAMCDRYDATLVVNDYWSIAIDEGCSWIHLGQEDLDGADMAAIRAAKLKLGISTHDHAELARALRLSPDYVALGPIWPTVLKVMKWQQQGVAKLTEWKSIIGDTPLVAIGGLTKNRAASAFDAGADVVSVVTDITLNDDPEGQVRAWLKICA